MATPRIFVSHSHLDEDITKKLVADLKRAGADVWVDIANIRDGDFMLRINNALAQCEWLVLVETDSSLQSEAVQMEVNAALELVRRKRFMGVIPFVAAPISVNVPPLWTTLHYYDAPAQGYDRAFRGLEQALGLWVEPAEPIAPPVTPQMPPAPQPLPSYSVSAAASTYSSYSGTASSGFSILKLAGRAIGMIAGIIGAVLNFVVNLAHSSAAHLFDVLSGSSTAGIPSWWGTTLCIVGLIGAIIGIPFPRGAAILMLISGIGMIFVLPWYLAAVGSGLLLVGAILVWLDRIRRMARA